VFEKLNQLFADKENNAFQIGHEVNRYLDELVAADQASGGEQVPLRTVLTHVLDELAGHRLGGIDVPGLYTKHFKGIDSARDRFGAYVRTSRFFTADRLAELPPITFSLASACIVTGEWPLPDETKTLERLNYALESGCDAAGIYGHFMGRDEETAEAKALRRMVKAMERYLDAVEKTDPASEIAKQVRALLRFVENGEMVCADS
jgi:hypothetical protein